MAGDFDPDRAVLVKQKRYGAVMLQYGRRLTSSESFPNTVCPELDLIWPPERFNRG